MGQHWWYDLEDEEQARVKDGKVWEVLFLRPSQPLPEAHLEAAFHRTTLF